MHTLVSTHFPTTYDAVAGQIPPSPIEIEAERLLAEADRPFRVKVPVSDRADDGYYVRHEIFPSVVREPYGYACAVCGADATDNRGSYVVQAAHIIPFNVSHSDNPRNGIVLCGNHHTGFDRGWYSITDDMRVIVSPGLKQEVEYVQSGREVRIPALTKYSPAPEAIYWHRKKWFGRG